MKRRITIRRHPKTHSTNVSLSGPVVAIHLKVVSKLSPRQRRAIALSFFRQIKPCFKYFRAGGVFQSDSNSFDFFRNERRGVNLFRSSEFATPHGELGFKIRIRRLEKGWSQSKLATKAKLCDRHLSRIERGLCRPSRATLQKIERSFEPRPTENRQNKL